MRACLLLAEHGGVALQRDDARAQQHARAAPLKRVDQPAPGEVVAAERTGIGDLEAVARLLVDLAAERDALVDERHGDAGGGRLRGRRHSRRSAPDDEDVCHLGRGRHPQQAGTPGNAFTPKSFS
jgi:hypothetical protein